VPAQWQLACESITELRKTDQVHEVAGPRVLIDVDDDTVGHADRQWLQSSIGTGPQTILLQTQGGRHTIAPWAERVIPALQTLFEGRCRG
jgi:hypothetical protein